METSLVNIFTFLRHCIWSPLFLVLLLGVALYFTFILRAVQLRHLGRAIKLALTPCSSGVGSISPYQALMTTLAGAVGTGNIVGIATAVTLGGVGAIFWVWVVGLLGMATTYAETLLAVEFRQKGAQEEVVGGSMYILLHGVGNRTLATTFALCAVLASFGIGGVVQSNSLSMALDYYYQVPPLYTGLFMAMLTALVILGGIQSIGRIASIIVPVMAVVYLGLGLFVIFCHLPALPSALGMIIQSAFTGQGMVGGFAGASSWMAIQMGVSRGIFCSEAGLGSATFAAAAAHCDHPSRQGLVSMIGTFVSTLVVCTVTGLVLAMTQTLGTVDAEGRLLDAAPLAIHSFRTVLPGAQGLIILCLWAFGFTTVLAWAYYGEKSLEFLLGPSCHLFFRLVYTVSVAAGALLPLQLVWAFADTMNGLMALPHLLGLLWLSPLVYKRSQEYGLLSGADLLKQAH